MFRSQEELAKGRALDLECPQLEEFIRDLQKMCSMIADGPLKTFCYKILSGSCVEAGRKTSTLTMPMEPQETYMYVIIPIYCCLLVCVCCHCFFADLIVLLFIRIFFLLHLKGAISSCFYP